MSGPVILAGRRAFALSVIFSRRHGYWSVADLRLALPAGLPAGGGGSHCAGATAALRGEGGLAAVEDLQSLQDSTL